MMEMIEKTALELICGYCKAGQQEWCTTASGGMAQYLHQSRVWLLHQVWADGYITGENDARDYARRYPEEFQQMLIRQAS